MGQGLITAKQYEQLMKPLNSTRVASRSQGGKQLSYLESWDVRAHLIRVFGFGNYDLETMETHLVYERAIEVGQAKTPGWEVAYLVTMRLVVYAVTPGYPDEMIPEIKQEIARYSESAVGSATGSVDLGGLHDNALKTAASDAMKRCAINLGTQFGLSLYDNGSRNDVVKGVLVLPFGVEQKRPGDDLSDQAKQTLAESLGATVVSEGPAEPEPDAVIRTPEDAAKAAETLKGKTK
jgi:hypothetical protein